MVDNICHGCLSIYNLKNYKPFQIWIILYFMNIFSHVLFNLKLKLGSGFVLHFRSINKASDYQFCKI